MFNMDFIHSVKKYDIFQECMKMHVACVKDWTLLDYFTSAKLVKNIFLLRRKIDFENAFLE